MMMTNNTIKLLIIALISPIFFTTGAIAQNFYQGILQNNFTVRASSKMCHGGVFKPCLCPSSVPKSVIYHPAEESCGGNAAIILRAPYLKVYSVVVRDGLNRDRWPAEGANGCSSALANSESPPNRCSVFKVQRKFYRTVNGKKQRVNCLGAPGASSLFSGVQRITAKLNDVPGSSTDKIIRWCIIEPECGMNTGSEVDCKKA